MDLIIINYSSYLVRVWGTDRTYRPFIIKLYFIGKHYNDRSQIENNIENGVKVDIYGSFSIWKKFVTKLRSY